MFVNAVVGTPPTLLLFPPPGEVAAAAAACFTSSGVAAGEAGKLGGASSVAYRYTVN